MTSLKSTALAAVAFALLAGAHTVLLEGKNSDVLEPVCNVTEALTCYWEKAFRYGVEIFRPDTGVDFLHNVCAEMDELPVDSGCLKSCKDGSKEEKYLFRHQENFYYQLRLKVLTRQSCKGAQRLVACTNKDVLEKCPVKFATPYTPEHALKNYESAKNLSKCLDEALNPCSEADLIPFKEYLKKIAEYVTEIYKYETPVTTSPPTQKPTAETTTAASTTPATHSPSTHESTTQSATTDASTAHESTTHSATTDASTAHASTTEAPTSHESSTQPSTTTAPVSAAPSTHAVSAFGFVAFLLLARGA